MGMRGLVIALLLGAASAFAPSASRSTRVAPPLAMETKADLETLQKKLNPVIPFFDPLGLADATFYGGEASAWKGFEASNEASIAWLRHPRSSMVASPWLRL